MQIRLLAIAALCAVFAPTTALLAQTQSPTVRDVAEAAESAIGAQDGVQTITDILRSNLESGNNDDLDRTCIIALDTGVKAVISPIQAVRSIFGKVSDPALDACVAQYCAQPEGHTSFAKWVYSEHCGS